MADTLTYLAGGLLAAWGASHLVPTAAVAASFGPISRDNRLILVMGWVAEGVAQISFAALVVLAAALNGPGSVVSLVDRVTAAALLALAVLTAFTGARTPLVWFKACPFVLTTVAGLLVAASLL